MADVERLLANGGWAIIGVVVGASLPYFFGVLNRRHQEAREDRTRWYETRLQAYVELYQAAYDVHFSAWESSEMLDRAGRRVMDAVGAIHFLGSPEVVDASERVLDSVLNVLAGKTKGSVDFVKKLEKELRAFRVASRNDLGHPARTHVTTRQSATSL